MLKVSCSGQQCVKEYCFRFPEMFWPLEDFEVFFIVYMWHVTWRLL